jgi:hypothetical protein
MTWEREKRYAKEGIRGHGWTARISWFLGVIFAIIGFITEVIDTTFIVQPMSWYLLSIATFASGIINVSAWLGGIYLYAKETKK